MRKHRKTLLVALAFALVLSAFAVCGLFAFAPGSSDSAVLWHSNRASQPADTAVLWHSNVVMQPIETAVLWRSNAVHVPLEVAVLWRSARAI
jgi:hypothetical protein